LARLIAKRLGEKGVGRLDRQLADLVAKAAHANREFSLVDTMVAL
jgi:hypothetical protein